LEMWGYDVPEMDEEELAPVEAEEEKPFYLKVEGDQEILMVLVDELNAKGVTVTVKS